MEPFQEDTLEAAVRRLIEMLDTASKIYIASPSHRRAATRRALYAVHEFVVYVVLGDIDAVRQRELMYPLSMLDAALDDLDRGIPSQIFKPKLVRGRRGGSGRPRDSRDHEIIKGLAAAHMSFLMTVNKFERREAAGYVADALIRGGVTLDGKLDWNTVSSWRYQIVKAAKAAPSPKGDGLGKEQIDRDLAAGVSPAAAVYLHAMRMMRSAKKDGRVIPGGLDPGSARKRLGGLRQLLAKGGL